LAVVLPPLLFLEKEDWKNGHHESQAEVFEAEDSQDDSGRDQERQESR
jgi:hypothetical protein